MRSKFPRTVRRPLALAATAIALALAGASAGAASPPPKLIKDPHYGDVLFHFYQERYFSAITGLMVSQHFNRVSQHADEAEVLRGGMLLSYGMHKEAGDIFAQLIEKGAAPPVRDRAWFYLAKIRYQRGYLDESKDALSRIEKNLPRDLEEERGLLQANVLLALKDYEGATQVLNELMGKAKDEAKSGRNAALYARYNLGVALIRNADSAGGTALLDELGRAETPKELAGEAANEFRSLRDKANVAIGLAALKDNRPEDARKALERVRLNGLESNKALLGFGWAASAMGEHKKALAPWIELLDRDIGDSAVLEARIAVPYAYMELGAFGQALNGYNQAIELFERENGQLDESIAAIRGGKLIDGLLERNPGEEMGWFWSIREFPQMPYASHLTSVLAEHEFQEAFKNFRDLQFLGRNLARWKDNLGAFDDMLDTRQKAFAERLPKALEQLQQTGLPELEKRAGSHVDEVKGAEEKADGLVFADERERGLIERLDDVKGNLDALPDSPETRTARERHRLAAGAMTWNLAQSYSVRLWEAKKALQALTTGIEEARAREAALIQAQKDEPAKFEAFAKRIAELHQRVDVLIPQVAALTQEQQQDVQELAVAELVRQKERLAAYTLQARFAVAQLYDRAQKGKEADDAPK
jgi:TolA-binding protein